ncbi:MAG: aromatic ring-hydroxylating dioxygenase subunit alpha [Pseudomonadota bacterium]
MLNAPAPSGHYSERFREIAEAPAGRETGLDGNFYIDPALYAAEVSRILTTEWLYLCRADELPEPGDYLTLVVLDEPLLVVRGDDGEIRVLSNICRHRNSPVALGAGRSRLFVCPYHAWSYGRDGRLVSAPRMEAARVDKARCGLPRHKIEVWMGFVYVNLDGSAEPLAPRLEPLRDRLAPYDTAAMRHVHTAEEVWRTNWKTLVENFMEAYHLSVVHTKTLHAITPTALSQKFDGGSAFSGYCANYPENAPVRGKGAVGLSAEERRRSTLFSVFPCQVVSQSASLLASYALFPEGPETVRVRWSLSVHDDELSPEEVAERIALWTVVNTEDRDKLERTQRNFRSRFAQSGPLAPADFEGVVADFHRYLARFLAL